MTFDQRLHEVNLNNLSYLAELCRAHGQEAQVCLHVPPELAEILIGAKPADLDRGKLLYENHCLECHESQVHIREHRHSSSIGDVVFQIDRWQSELKLNWRIDEMNDVLRYLDDRFYRFKERP